MARALLRDHLRTTSVLPPPPPPPQQAQAEAAEKKNFSLLLLLLSPHSPLLLLLLLRAAAPPPPPRRGPRRPAEVRAIDLQAAEVRAAEVRAIELQAAEVRAAEPDLREGPGPRIPALGEFEGAAFSCFSHPGVRVAHSESGATPRWGDPAPPLPASASGLSPATMPLQLSWTSSQAPKTSTQSHTKQRLTKPGVAQFSGLADARLLARVLLRCPRGLQPELQAEVQAMRVEFVDPALPRPLPPPPGGKRGPPVQTPARGASEVGQRDSKFPARGF